MNEAYLDDYAFGYAVDQVRRELEMSKTDLARRLGVTVGTLSAWKKQGSQPRTDLRARAIEILGIDDDDLRLAREEVRHRWRLAHPEQEAE